MKPRFFVNDAIAGITSEINSMIEKGEDVDPVLDDIGWVVELEVRNALPRSKKHHVHMQDDITHTVRTNSRGQRYVSVRGEGETGYKWHIVNDDHLSNSDFTKGKLRRRDGYKTAKGMKARIVPGLKFIEKAMLASQHKIDLLIDEYVGGIADDTTK